MRYPERCSTLTLAATSAGFVHGARQPGVLMKLLSPRRYLDPAYLLHVGGQLFGGLLRLGARPAAGARRRDARPSQRGYLYQTARALGLDELAPAAPGRVARRWC